MAEILRWQDEIATTHRCDHSVIYDKMKKPFSVGDVVTLKSGGHLMVIEDLCLGGDACVSVVWSCENKITSKEIEIYLLEPAHYERLPF